ncbi:20836_t:CDS:1, partial [Gigaspora margarita]
YKPQMIEQEIVRLNQVVIDKDQEIKSLRKQLIAYRLLKQQVESLFTIIELDNE